MKKFFYLNSILTLLILLTGILALSGCQTTSSLYQKNQTLSAEILCPWNENAEWTKIQDGFFSTGYKIEYLNVTWHCVKIDLDTKNLEFFIEPTHVPENSKTPVFFLKDFAAEKKAIVAINTTPFALKERTYKPLGITKINGKIISPCLKRYCALGFTEKKDKNGTTTGFRASIFQNQIPEEIEECTYAIGGFFKILDKDYFYPFKHSRRSRVACGISDEGKYLYIFCCTPVFAINDQNGLNYEECAIILKELGCTQAMQFDGGHSSGLIVNGKHLEQPQDQRKIPTALAICINKN